MPRTNLRLHVISPKEGSYFFNKVFEGTRKAEEELKQFGVKIQYFYTKHHNASRQTQLLAQVLDLRPDGIAIIPASTTALNYLIDEAVDMDIPVVTFNNDAPYSKRFCYVGPDNYASGRLCGELMGNFLSAKGNVIVFSASSEVYGLRQRLIGFKDKLKSSFPEIRILKVLDYMDEEEICYEQALEELSKTEEEIHGIFTTSATGTVAIGKALKKLNLSSIPKVIGYDPNELVYEYVINGYIHALIYQDPFSQGYLSLKVLHNYVANGIVPEKECLFTEISIVLQENIENFISLNI